MKMNDLTITNGHREQMLPIVNEQLGNVGGSAHVESVISKYHVIACIPALGWHFPVTVDRGFHGGLMAVKGI